MDQSNLIGTMALVPSIVDFVQCRIPVIAAGGKKRRARMANVGTSNKVLFVWKGIMDGRGIIASHALGAEAVQVSQKCDDCGNGRQAKDTFS